MIHTRRWFDRKAPRTIVLAEGRLRQLYVLGGLLFTFMAMLFFLFPGGEFLLFLLVVALAGGRKGMAAIATPWLDLAGAETRR